MNGVALCAGVGGLELGFELAVPDARVVCYVEREAHAASVLVARMEENLLAPAPVWSDLTTFEGDRWRGRVDFVAAGFPCQPWSAAGAGKGTDDERWIWPTIVDRLREMDPWLVWLENVPPLVSRGGLALVLRDLAELGFAVEWGLLSAADVGATHRRERLFILAYRSRVGLAGLRTALDDDGRDAQRDVADGRDARDVADADGRHAAGRSRGPGSAEGRQPRDQPTGPGEVLADGERAGLQGHAGHEPDGREPGRVDPGSRRPAGASSPYVGDPYGFGLDTRGLHRQRDEIERWAGRTAGRPVEALGDAARRGRGERGQPSGCEGRRLADGPDERPVVADAADGFVPEPGRRSETRAGVGSAGAFAGVPVFPPGPRDGDLWRRILERHPDLAPAVVDATRLREHGRDGEDRGRGRGVPQAGDAGRGGNLADASGDAVRVEPERDQRRGRSERAAVSGNAGAREDGPVDVDEEGPAEPAIRRVADGSAPRVDRLRACGNGVVPLAVAYAFVALRARALVED